MPRERFDYEKRPPAINRLRLLPPNVPRVVRGEKHRVKIVPCKRLLRRLFARAHQFRQFKEKQFTDMSEETDKKTYAVGERSIVEIVKDLSKPIAAKHLNQKRQGGKEITFC